MSLKNLSANCFRKFKRLQLTFQVVSQKIHGALILPHTNGKTHGDGGEREFFYSLVRQ
jgi:hypothetical protein